MRDLGYNGNNLERSRWLLSLVACVFVPSCVAPIVDKAEAKCFQPGITDASDLLAIAVSDDASLSEAMHALLGPTVSKGGRADTASLVFVDPMAPDIPVARLLHFSNRQVPQVIGRIDASRVLLSADESLCVLNFETGTLRPVLEGVFRSSFIDLNESRLRLLAPLDAEGAHGIYVWRFLCRAGPELQMSWPDMVVRAGATHEGQWFGLKGGALQCVGEDGDVVRTIHAAFIPAAGRSYSFSPDGRRVAISVKSPDDRMFSWQLYVLRTIDGELLYNAEHDYQGSVSTIDGAESVFGSYWVPQNMVLSWITGALLMPLPSNGASLLDFSESASDVAAAESAVGGGRSDRFSVAGSEGQFGSHFAIRSGVLTLSRTGCVLATEVESFSKECVSQSGRFAVVRTGGDAASWTQDLVIVDGVSGVLTSLPQLSLLKVGWVESWRDR